MLSRIVSKKVAIILGGIFVLLIGTVIGSFLVLRSSQGEGKLFLLENDAASSASLLEELARIAEEARLTTPPEGNATSELTAQIGALSTEVDFLSVDPEIDPAFSDQAIDSLLAAEEQKFFPTITDEDITISSTQSAETYKQELAPHIKLITETFLELLGSDLETLTSSESQEMLDEASGELARATDKIHKLTVPEPYGEAHKRVLAFSIATNRSVFSLSKMDEDPTRALLSLLFLPRVAESLDVMLRAYGY